jgi:hypothetical protein
VGVDGLWALTADRTGSNLPPEQAPWLQRSIALTGLQPDEQEAEALIREFGFCCFDGGAKDN